MGRTRRIGVAARLAAGALALTACGSSGGSSSSTTSAQAAGGGTTAGGATSSAATQCASGSLKGEGSTAQKNVMNTWIQKYQQLCTGTTISYNATGSGA